MQEQDSEVVYEQEENIIQDKISTYDDEEKQNNEINEANSKLIFQPKFIPYYPELTKMNLTDTAIILFGFIDFYLRDASKKFYFSNEDLSKIINKNESTITSALKELKNIGYINIYYKIKSGGGRIRFIKLQELENHILKTCVSSVSKLGKPNFPYIVNNNKIKENKIKENKRMPFQKPSIQEVKDYCKYNDIYIDAERFWNYYESKGWLVGKSPMKNWHSAIANWKKNNFDTNKKPPNRIRTPEGKYANL